MVTVPRSPITIDIMVKFLFHHFTLGRKIVFIYIYSLYASFMPVLSDTFQ